MNDKKDATPRFIQHDPDNLECNCAMCQCIEYRLAMRLIDPPIGRTVDNMPRRRD